MQKLPWSSYELGQLFLTKSFFPDLGIMSYVYVFSCTGVIFWGRAHTPMHQGALLIRLDTTPEASYASLH